MNSKTSELLAQLQDRIDLATLPEDLYVLDLLRRSHAEIVQLQNWVSDCQSGMYINCVYCGHRYGPRENTPVAMADVLREHCEQCPKHPLSAERQKNAELEDKINWWKTTDAARLAEIARLKRATCCVFRVTDGVTTGWCYSFYDHFDVHWDDGVVQMQLVELSLFGIRKIEESMS